MAKLSSFRVNAKAISDGEWISPGEEYDDLMFKVRGLTDSYRDSLARKLRNAAKGFGGDQSKIPSTLFRAAICDALNEHVLLDVKNLAHDNGKIVTIEEFRKLLPTVEYTELREAVISAATRVGRNTAEDIAEAGEPSAQPSA